MEGTEPWSPKAAAGVLEMEAGHRGGKGLGAQGVSKGCGGLGPPGFPWRTMLGLQRDRQCAQSGGG